LKVEEILEQTFECIQQTEIGEKIVDLLLPNGEPHSFENDLWDYKRKPPYLGGKPDNSARDLHKLETHELIKDVVSFHNSFGGYLIFGVEDSGKDRLIGCDLELNLDDLGKRIKAQTGADVELYQKKLKLGSKGLLLLLVPRRRSFQSPVRFIKGAPELGNNKPAYQKNSVYIRKLNECRPANNTADDWAFLFSDRKISTSTATKSKDQIPSNIPPRDPDMVNFVGREPELCLLRSWILDQRNPIKLISGIGGLGKTSVAYHFCEELASTGAGEFDFIAWVSAKKSTFAALSGKMVKTTRHDFSTVDELLRGLITIVAGESSVEEGMDIDDYTDVLTDALTYRPCFIVVDDLDSLSPDEQRECATILQQIAFRTVDREHAGSRILLTSRLDQGLSPTAVIKIVGLEFEAFEEHIKNLCRQFGLSEFSSSLIKQIYQTASGSPLFASAIVRMTSLGENPKEVCSAWASKDGEDVREFAFKRELDRLSVGGASVLLAVVNLGEVSTDELLEVVEISKKILLDRINELQSFHLLAKSENRHGDLVLSTSKELLSSANILRKKLGQQSHEVERRCAVIRKNQGDQTREIGRKIREIVGFFDERLPEEALIVAKSLAKRNPKNGDVWCILARAYLFVKPEQYAKADEAASKAFEFSCSRPELFEYTVLSKRGIEDWQGLKQYAENKRFKSKKHDPALDAYLVAVSRLSHLASERGSYLDAANHAMDGVKRISEKIQGSYLEPTLFEKLMRDQNRLAGDAIRCRQKSIQRPRDNLSVSDLGFELINLNVQTREVVLAICDGLRSWSNAVKSSSVIDEAELDILANNSSRLERLKGLLSSCSRDVQQELQVVDQIQKQLGFVGAAF